MAEEKGWPRMNHSLQAQNRHFVRSISTDNQGRDEIDREVDDDRVEAPWPEVNPPTRRKDSEVAHILDILDKLQTGKELA